MNNERVIPLIAPLVALLALAWVALLVAAPALPAAPSGVVYGIGSLICHQIAERSFHLGAFQLPVCARCLAIYAGFACGASLARVGGSAVARSGPRLVVAASAIPTAVTVAAEWIGLWQPSNAARFAAGLPLGVAVGLVVVAALATLHSYECVPRPPIASSRPPSRI
jgi:uncharacterized membrane protein